MSTLQCRLALNQMDSSAMDLGGVTWCGMTPKCLGPNEIQRLLLVAWSCRWTLRPTTDNEPLTICGRVNGTDLLAHDSDFPHGLEG